jgi:hypothetical protein
MKNLIEKYLNGETSLHEEAELKAYFNSGQVEDSLKEYQPLFQFFENEKQLELSADFDEKLFEKIAAQGSSEEDLIEKYFKGETSLEEETELNTYFNSDQIDPKHQAYQPLFQYFKKEQEVEVSKGFDKRLFEKIENQGAKVIQLRSFTRRLMRVAAVAVVFLAAYLFFNKPAEQAPPVVDWSAYEIHDEQLAYEETVKALRLLSSKINKGKKKTVDEVSKSEPVSKYLN